MEISKELCRSILLDLKKYHNEFGVGESVKRLSEPYSQNTYITLFEKSVFESPSQSPYEIRHLLESRTNQSEEIPPTDDDVWVFGYGSLVWKADFPFIDRRHGFITGYKRRFFQESIDHRGTPTKPGRVVTLVPTHKLIDRVYGTAYRIASKHKDDVQRHLDHREKNGYERCVLRFQEFPESTDISFDVVMYIATEENESYAGHISELSLIADEIFTSAGPSGPNRDYLFNLAKAMRVLFPGVEDEHLYELEAAVIKRVKFAEPTVLERALKLKIQNIFISKITNEDEIDMDACVEEAVREINQLRVLCEHPGWRETILAEDYLADKCLKTKMSLN